MKLALTIVLFAAALALAHVKVYGASAKLPLPPLPPTNHVSAAVSQGDAAKAQLAGVKPKVVIAPKPIVITVSWTNPPAPAKFSATNYVSALEVSTNGKAWTVLATLPYQPSCSVMITNPPSPSFYWAYNAVL